MAALIYGLCSLTSALCAWVLFQAHGRMKYRLLLWCGLFFAVTTLNNVLLVVDKVFLPTEIDLSVMRYMVSIAALAVLFRGLIFEVE